MEKIRGSAAHEVRLAAVLTTGVNVCNWHFAMVRCGAIFRPLLNELRNELAGAENSGL